MKLNTKYLKIIITYVITLFLLYFSINELLTVEHRKIINSISFRSYIFSGLFIFSSFIIAGVQLNNVYTHSKIVKLSTFDIFTMPMLMNFWGYIIPFQGSFVFSAIYLKSKYNVEITTMTGIYLSVMSVSLALGGGCGIVFFYCSESISLFFLIISLILFFNPFLIFFLSRILLKSKKLKSLIGGYYVWLFELLTPILLYFKNPKLLILTLLLDITLVLIFAIWSYWISIQYAMDIPFFALLITGFLLKVTLLLKITPGNLGLMQLGIGGIFSTLGLNYSDGVFISIYQLVCLVIITFPISVLISIFNIKYLSFFK